MWLLAIFCISLRTVAAAAVLPSSHHVIHERRDHIPVPWHDEGRVPGNVVLPVRIGLAQSNLDVGHNLLMDLSSQDSPNHRNWLSPEEIVNLFAPSEETVSMVREWLESAGVTSRRISQSANKQWLQFDATVEEVEALIQAEFYSHTDHQSGKSHISCEKYHLPGHVSHLVDYVTPGVMPFSFQRQHGLKRDKRSSFSPAPKSRPLPMTMSTLKNEMSKGVNYSHCPSAVTPDCVFRMYDFSPGTTAHKGNELGIFQDLGQVYSQKDLDSYFANIYPKIPNGTHPTLDSIDGGKAPTTPKNAGSEADFDFEFSYPLIWPQQSILFQTDDMVYENNYTFQGLFDTFLSAIDGSYCQVQPEDPSYPDPAPDGFKHPMQCGVYKPTNVISISYSGVELSGLSIAYQRRQCHEYLKLGLQGSTVIFSSGDAGVFCYLDVFSPGFPVNCPYVLVSGATALPPGANVIGNDEVASTVFPSGGGFSNVFPRPAYQNSAVETYFERAKLDFPYYETGPTINVTYLDSTGGYYNRLGRAYPDVSAIGQNIVFYGQGEAQLFDGTSAAAPAWASIITRINEELLAKGRPTVGFINPTLYSHPEVFHDVTVGDNIFHACGSQGFIATKGWDPVTGLGTPNYPELLKLFMQTYST